MYNGPVFLFTIGSYNGLSPVLRPTMAWIIADVLSIEILEIISEKYWSQFEIFIDEK